MSTTSIKDLFDHNRLWAEQMERDRPGFFTGLMSQQHPKYMWIGCSDSRVPANQITGLEPGEVFVHRNVANVVVPSDLNCLSTIQYSVDQLKIQDLMVVGHYGCGGVLATLRGMRVGLADNWLRHVHDVKVRHRRRLDHLSLAEQEDVLCEMNVIEQVGNVALTNVGKQLAFGITRVARQGVVDLAVPLAIKRVLCEEIERRVGPLDLRDAQLGGTQSNLP